VAKGQPRQFSFFAEDGKTAVAVRTYGDALQGNPSFEKQGHSIFYRYALPVYRFRSGGCGKGYESSFSPQPKGFQNPFYTSRVDENISVKNETFNAINFSLTDTENFCLQALPG
jgi:hypothetical protein